MLFIFTSYLQSLSFFVAGLYHIIDNSLFLRSDGDFTEHLGKWTEILELGHVHLAQDSIELGVEWRAAELEGVEIEGEAGDQAVGVIHTQVLVIV